MQFQIDCVYEKSGKVYLICIDSTQIEIDLNNNFEATTI